MSNKTVCKFEYKNKKYQVDQLLDSLDGYDDFYFDIFDCTIIKRGICVGQFNTYEGDDYKKLTIEYLTKDALNVEERN